MSTYQQVQAQLVVVHLEQNLIMVKLFMDLLLLQMDTVLQVDGLKSQEAHIVLEVNM